MFLDWILIFLLIAFVAMALGLGGLAGAALTVVRWLVIIFVVLLVVSLLH